MSTPACGCGGFVVFRGAPRLSEYACGPCTGQYENGWSSVTGPPPLLGIDAFCAACAARSAASRACLASAAPRELTRFEILLRRLARFDRSDLASDSFASRS